MNLLEIRKWFIEASGRADLVVDLTAYADNGADKYINAGSKYLDRRTEFKNQPASVFRLLASGEYIVKFQRARVIEAVWAGTATDGLYPLECKSYAEIRELYDDIPSSITTGDPLYYVLTNFRGMDLDDIITDGITGFMDVTTESNEYDGVLIYPPVDESYHIEVRGKFFSEKLTDDTDENHWSINEEDVLVMSAMLSIEKFYRNTQGVNDWRNALTDSLFGIEKDFVDEDTTDINQIEG